MGWTHESRDVAREPSGNGAATRTRGAARGFPGGPLPDPAIRFPDILRRRARWVSVRLRHPRG
ncbi:hypothetical protein EBN88_15210 [Streptomyces triticirhizae]|uniref:Uncharacterized protein n=1 Tax=Streptomyces triticirhizae TaxID=2483353 RepID=A0A3M2LPL6_9ACTN|nr:hypothetical protein EBN88_15210 [Streptomyces triticirhizae]